jgi:hypothetical protein
MTSKVTNTCIETTGYVILLQVITGSKYVLSDTKTASLILSTCTVLVIYKVLALVCAWSKSDRKTTTVNKYVPALRQKYSIQL